MMNNATATKLAPTQKRETLLNDPYRMLNQRMNRLFESNFTPFGFLNEENWSLAEWSPVCDMFDNGNEIVVKADLPEVKKEDIRLSLENNILAIRGERKFSDEAAAENYHRIERRYGEFQRTFTLPNTIDPNKINAELKEGVLRVTLAKREETKPKLIDVKVR